MATKVRHEVLEPRHARSVEAILPELLFERQKRSWRRRLEKSLGNFSVSRRPPHDRKKRLVAQIAEATDGKLIIIGSEELGSQSVAQPTLSYCFEAMRVGRPCVVPRQIHGSDWNASVRRQIHGMEPAIPTPDERECQDEPVESEHREKAGPVLIPEKGKNRDDDDDPHPEEDSREAEHAQMKRHPAAEQHDRKRSTPEEQERAALALKAKRRSGQSRWATFRTIAARASGSRKPSQPFA